MSTAGPAQIAHWQPQVLVAGAHRLAAAAELLSAVARRLTHGLAPGAVAEPGVGWSGPASRRALESVRGHVQVLLALAAALTIARDGLARGAPRLQAAKDDSARAHAGLPGPDGLLGPLALTALTISWPWPGPGAAAVVTAETLLVLARRDAAVGAARTAAAEVTAALDEAGSRCRGVLAAQSPWALRADVRASLGDHGLHTWLGRPPPDADPGDVAGWWAAHTPAEQRVLAADLVLGPLLGGLDGIPATVRDRANRTALARRLVGGESVADRAILEQLAPAAAPLDPATGRPQPPLLLVFRPDAAGGRGEVALAYGDPGTARHVAVVVPGLGTHVDPDLHRLVGDATALWRTTRRLSGAPAVAVVAWLGYDTPDLPQVALDGRARSGAELLARTVDGLRATRETDPPHLTVVGHSYGSVVAGLAVRRSPGSVDDLVVVGSPGVEADHAVDLPVGAGTVWVGAASGDPVSRLSRFGVDPAAADFGGRRFRAETRTGVAQHSHYFDEGSESLRAMAAVVAGRGAQVVLAAPRSDHGYLGALLDPLLPPPFRLGTDPAGKDPESTRRPHP